MMNGFGLMLEATNRKDALREVIKWVDKELGEPAASIKVEGNKTTVTLPDGRVGVSRCNPCDKFDIITGIRVALDDIEKRSWKLTDEEKIYLKVAKKAGAEYVIHYHYHCSIDDIWFTAEEQTDETDSIKLSIEDNTLFSHLEDDKFYKIETLLRERS